MRRAAVVALILTMALLANTRAAAEERPRIVVIGGKADSAVLRLRAELAAIGFDVVAEVQAEAVGREPLEDAAQRASAVAAIRLVRSRAGVELWIVDRVTGKFVLREVVSADLAAGGDRTLVLRAVELLRASFLEVDAPHPPRGQAPASKAFRELVDLPERAAPPPAPTASVPTAEPAPASAPQLRPALGLGPAVFVTPGGLAPMVHTRVSLDLQVGDVGATLWTLLPMVPDHVTGPEGAADVRLFLVAAGGRVELGPRKSAWSSQLGLGAAFGWVATRGRPASGAYAGQSDTAFTPGPYASVGLSYAVTSLARIDASVAGGLLLPPQRILLGAREEARFGPAFVMASIGISLGAVDRGEAAP